MAEWNDDNERELVIKNHNRVLRRVNKALRSSHRLTQEYNDALFKELCNAGTEAELAMEKLWALGNFSCDPKDYETIVVTCIQALSQTQQAVAKSEALPTSGL